MRGVEPRHLDGIIQQFRKCSASSSAIVSCSRAPSESESRAGQDGAGGAFDQGQRRLELVRHGVDQRRPELLALPRGFDLMGEILRPARSSPIATRLATP